MQRSADYLLAQINNLLLASKLDATDSLAATPIWFDLGLLLQDLYAQFSHLGGQPGVALRFDVQGPIPQQICADEIKLREILANLLDNAVKFTISGQVALQIVSQPEELGRGQVNSAVPQPDTNRHYSLTFAVADTGPGIDRSDLERLFSPFEQSEPGQRSQTGSGLGLFICQEYVRLLGGELRCHSQLGAGSCFEFTLRVKGSGQTLPQGAYPSDSPSTPTVLPPALAEHLKTMPSAWCEQLRLATAKGDDGAILTLLQDLPLDCALLGDWLHHWATNFQFDSILDLIQEATPDLSKISSFESHY
jgi:Histidine kinase-, DNA gyrase B-, and HSP90-like ATPase